MFESLFILELIILVSFPSACGLLYSYFKSKKNKKIEKEKPPSIKNWSVNSKITKAFDEGLIKSLEKEKEKRIAIQIEKERLLNNDYIYDKIKSAVSKNEFQFTMVTDNNEITKDAINLIPGMKAYIDKFSNLTVTFPNRE